MNLNGKHFPFKPTVDSKIYFIVGNAEVSNPHVLLSQFVFVGEIAGQQLQSNLCSSYFIHIHFTYIHPQLHSKMFSSFKTLSE